MQTGGSWLVRKGHCSECCVGRDQQGRQGLCVSHSPDKAPGQGQSWLPSAPLHCQGTWGERWGEEPSRDWEQRNSVCAQHLVSGITSSWDRTCCFAGLLDSSLQPPPAGSCYSRCFLHPSPVPSKLFFLFSSLWSWPNYPPAQGLRHLLPSRNVCSSCSSVPFSPVK